MIEDIEKKWEDLYRVSSLGDKQIKLSAEGIADLYLNINENAQKTVLLYVPETMWSDYRGFQHKNFDNLSIEFIFKNNKGWISISLKNDKLSDLFNDLIISLFRRVEFAGDPRGYCKIFIATYWKWARFFDIENQFKLSVKDILGLLGELVILNNLVLNPSLEISTVINGWKGPLGNDKDFIISNIALEVKTVTTTNDEINISSVYQLEPVLGKELFLIVLEMEQSTSGVSIGSIVNDISDNIINRGGSLKHFWESLNAMRITKENIDEYKSPVFKQKNMWCFLVDHPGFPRITRKDNKIPDLIKNVQYAINLNSLEPYIRKLSIIRP